MMDGLDTFNQQAFGVLTSSELGNALDLSNEDAIAFIDDSRRVRGKEDGIVATLATYGSAICAAFVH